MRSLHTEHSHMVCYRSIEKIYKKLMSIRRCVTLYSYIVLLLAKSQVDE